MAATSSAQPKYSKSMNPRIFSDKEVGEILRRAATIQSGSTEITTTDGTTLAELKRVAGEVGISSNLIGRAASELDQARTIIASASSNSVMVEQTLEGTLTDETWDRLVNSARAFTGKPGKSEFGSQTREWLDGSETGSIMLSGTNRNGRVQLKLLSDIGGGIALIFTFGLVASLLLPMIIGAIISKQNMPSAALIAFLTAISILIGTLSLTLWMTRQARKEQNIRVNAFMDSLVDIFESERTQIATMETESDAAVLRQPPQATEVLTEGGIQISSG